MPRPTNIQALAAALSACADAAQAQDYGMSIALHPRSTHDENRMIERLDLLMGEHQTQTHDGITWHDWGHGSIVVHERRVRDVVG